MRLTGEDAEHAAVIVWLRQRGIAHFHPANESRCAVQWRAKLRALGLRPGVSDIIIFDGPPLRLVALELKAAKGVASHEQREFIRTVEAAGGLGRVCYGREEAIEWLESLHLSPIRRG